MTTELQELETVGARNRRHARPPAGAAPIMHFVRCRWSIARRARVAPRGVDAYVSLGIERGAFSFDVKPPHIERPRKVEALAEAFRVVHQDAAARVARLQEGDMDRTIQYADGNRWTIRDLLWRKLLLHGVHHRGQLMLLCRLAGGIPPGLFGRTREERQRAAAVTHA